MALPLRSADLRPDYRPSAYAIRGARIVASADTTFDPGTVVVRDGVIKAVGKTSEVEIPFDAEVIDGKDLVVYPGFVDLYTTLGQPSGITRSQTGPGRKVPYTDFALPRTPADDRNGMTPEFQVASVLELPDSVAEERRRLGFTDLLAAPSGAIATGQSALVSTSGQPRREVLVQTPVGLHVSLNSPAEPPAPPRPDDPPNVARRRGGGATGSPGYPTSLMGVVAHLRQAMLDAQHDQDVRAYYAANKGGPVLPFDPALAALHAAQSGQIPIWWEANTRDEILRALDLSQEFGTKAVIVGGREAGKVAEILKNQAVPVVLRIDFAEEPKVPGESEYRAKSAEDRGDPLRVLADRASKWKERVATAKTLAASGVMFGFASDGLSKADTFHSQVRKVIDAGLPQKDAVKALTQGAAQIAGVVDRLGVIAPGKLGHLVALSAPYGDDSAKVRYVLQDSFKFEIKDSARSGGTGKGGGKKGSSKTAEPPQKGEGKTDDAEPKPVPKTQAEPPKAAPESAKPKTDESKKAAEEKSASNAQKAPAPDVASAAGSALTINAAPAPNGVLQKEKEKDAPQQSAAAGSEKQQESEASPPANQEKAEAKQEAQKSQEKAEPKQEPQKKDASTKAAADTKTQDENATKEKFVDVATELDQDRKPTIKTGGSVLIKDATILTVSPTGTIPKGSILVRDGKIVEVAPTIAAPEGVTVIDATGLVAMPGIIDTHSHIAIQGGVNEMSLSIVPEVRVRDVVLGDDLTIYRALAGGVTAARLLHGSANTIGGQDVVIKLRYGQPGRDLIIRDGGPQGVKFALGENVTRRTGRFPNTRMGVEATIERAFEEAEAYRDEWKAYTSKAAGTAGPRPRRDLRLEALQRILEGTYKIHCHCYRSDEILMLLNIASRHNVRVQSLQHVLEGYKVAAEIKEHGASTSTFSDWWAYKIEAFDAIPYNSALLAQAGVPVCIKSDDNELMRHLYAEAAKMIKYGDVSERQALEMITLNGARQLGLEHRLGSIERGKDADIVLFNAHPFDGFARCEMALIDGEVWFQRREAGGKLAARPGDHTTPPQAAAEARTRPVEIAASPTGVYAITGATIHPVSGPDIQNGTIVVFAGNITAIGESDKTQIPPGAQSVDLRGLDVWPGMVEAGSVLGLFEVGSLAETQDYADSAQFQPELHTSTALHPDSELIPVTRANGVLTTYVQPSGGSISGQGCVINLAGWVPSEMVLADYAALDVTIPRQITASFAERRARFRAPGGASEGADPNRARADRIDEIKAEFKRARQYDKVVAEAAAHKAAPPTPDPRMAALAPYAKGQKPVIFHAERRGEILDALTIAKEFGLKAIISGGMEAWKVAKDLKEADVPVLVGGTLQLPEESFDPYDAPYANPARLFEAGLKFAIRSSSRTPNTATAVRNLPYEAAMAVSYGLPEAEALKAVTLYPAQILGIADRVGSLEVGKRANLVITAGHLLQSTTVVKHLFIAGKPIPAESRHTRLYALYQRRLNEVRTGAAPLGIELRPTTLANPGTPAGAPVGPTPSGSENRR
jgi:imidazolonepropionase-like amidohydrolase